MKYSEAINTVAINTAKEVMHLEITEVENLNAMVGYCASELNLSFENEKAYNNFVNSVVKQIRRVNISAYRQIYPEFRMDQNGNYTTNKELWA